MPKIIKRKTLDKDDEEFVAKYALENGFSEKALLRFLKDYYLQCMYKKIKTLDKFCLGGFLMIYKYHYINRLVKQTNKNWRFYRDYYDFRVFPVSDTEWTRVPLERINRYVEKKDIPDLCEEMARKHDPLLKN